MTQDHVHDCTGPDLRCACGYVFSVPRLCVSLEVSDNGMTLATLGFNCDDIEVAAAALERTAGFLRRNYRR